MTETVRQAAGRVFEGADYYRTHPALRASFGTNISEPVDGDVVDLRVEPQERRGTVVLHVEADAGGTDWLVSVTGLKASRDDYFRSPKAVKYRGPIPMSIHTLHEASNWPGSPRDRFVARLEWLEVQTSDD